MRRANSSVTRRVVLAAVLVLGLSIAVAPVAQAKKKKSKDAVASATPNLAIPNGAAADPQPQSGPPVRSTVTIGKKFKGKEVASVAVTVQTTGTGEGAGGDLIADLIAPDGTTVFLFGNLLSTNIGPLTIQPNSPISPCQQLNFLPTSPPCPPETLGAPFAGTVGQAQMRLFNGVSMRGTWSLRVRDVFGPPSPGTNVLSSWSLRIKPAKN